MNKIMRNFLSSYFTLHMYLVLQFYFCVSRYQIFSFSLSSTMKNKLKMMKVYIRQLEDHSEIENSTAKERGSHPEIS